MDESGENSAWRGIDGTWRRVHGDFSTQGVSIEWHDFSVSGELDWARSYHENSLEICLNFFGEATFLTDRRRQRTPLNGGQVAIYTTTKERITANRQSGQQHRFFSFEFSDAYLVEKFRWVTAGLRPEVQAFCGGGGTSECGVRVETMPVPLLALRGQLLDPPVHPSAYPTWYESKLTEVLSYFLFQPQAPAELFCQQHLRVNRERCERAMFLLHRDMENPPSLEMLASEVGCSPFYLSRLFADTMGMSIPRGMTPKVGHFKTKVLPFVSLFGLFAALVR